MKKLYINCQSGLSGDMMLGALIDLGVPEDYLRDKLARLNLDEFELSVGERKVQGRRATDVDVILKEPENLDRDPYSCGGRNYGQIIDMINGSTLSNNAKVLSRRIFDIKARAEARVHQVPVEEVALPRGGRGGFHRGHRGNGDLLRLSGRGPGDRKGSSDWLRQGSMRLRRAERTGSGSAADPRR